MSTGMEYWKWSLLSGFHLFSFFSRLQGSELEPTVKHLNYVEKPQCQNLNAKWLVVVCPNHFCHENIPKCPKHLHDDLFLQDVSKQCASALSVVASCKKSGTNRLGGNVQDWRTNNCTPFNWQAPDIERTDPCVLYASNFTVFNAPSINKSKTMQFVVLLLRYKKQIHSSWDCHP